MFLSWSPPPTLGGQKEISPFFTSSLFPLRKSNPLQEEKETLCILRMEEGKDEREIGAGRGESLRLGVVEGGKRMRAGKRKQEDGGCPSSTPGSKSRALCKVLFQEMHMWLITYLTIGHPGLPRQVSVSHDENPSVPRTKSCVRIQANKHLRGGRAGPVPLPYLEGGAGGGDGRRPRRSPRADGARHTRPLAAAALGGAACNTKGVCGRGCVGGFPGPPAGPSWPPPPCTHPFGARSPSAEHRPGAAPGAASSCRRGVRALPPLQKAVERHWGQDSV